VAFSRNKGSNLRPIALNLVNLGRFGAKVPRSTGKIKRRVIKFSMQANRELL
jgi:hypothetical protein